MTSGWQDISTAPKDGTEILGCTVRVIGDKVYRDGPWTIAFRQREWVASWDGNRVVDYMSDFGTDYKDAPETPTHWQPLPAPPSDDLEYPGSGLK